MSQNKNIKKLNRKWLISYLLFNLTFFVIVAKVIVLCFSDVNAFLAKLSNPNSLFVIIAFPLSLVLEGVLSNRIKEFLVFWRIKDALPGCRAFTEIAVKDARIDLQELQNILKGECPQEPRKQNEKWYKLYRRYDKNPTVYDAHRAFLMTRDLTALTAILIPLTMLGHFLFGTDTARVLIHALILIFVLTVSSLSSRNYGKRFVANVLVEAISDEKESK